MRAEFDGIGLHVHERGQGPPIILLHAGPGLDGSIFFPWFEQLEGYRLLAPDLLGHGLSDAGDPSNWTWSGWADGVARLAETLELQDYTLLGHSFGARIALQHAVDHPGHAARIICSGGVSHRGAMEHLETTFESFGTPELRAKVEAAFEAEEHVETVEGFHQIWCDQMPFFLADPERPALGEGQERWQAVRYRPQMQLSKAPYPRMHGDLPKVPSGTGPVPLVDSRSPTVPYPPAKQATEVAPPWRVCGHS